MYDVNLRLLAENTRFQHGHGTINSHRQLGVLLDGLRKVQQDEDIRLQNVLITINGVSRRVNVKVPILYFMNDAKEGDMLCGRVAGHHHGTKQHCRVCNVLFVDMLDFEANCTMMLPAAIEALIDNEDQEALKELSQYCIKSCFRGFEFCNPTHGIFGAQPGDMLHMLNLGAVKEVARLMLDCLTPSEKVTLDGMGRTFNNRLRQTHRRNFPTTDFSRGITNTKQKTAEEYIGLLFVLCALMNNGDAWNLIHHALERSKLDIANILQLFECMLCFERWCKLAEYWTKQRATEEEQTAKNAIRLFLHLLVDTLPRGEGNGWALSKIHELLHVPMFITWLGAPMNYHTGACEHNHKYLAKRPGRRAAKNHKTFIKSVARNIVDSHVIGVFMDLLNKHDNVLVNYEIISDEVDEDVDAAQDDNCLLYTSPSPRDGATSRMPSSA